MNPGVVHAPDGSSITANDQMLVHRDAQGHADQVRTADGTSVDNNRDGSVDTMNAQGYTTHRDAQGNVVQTNPDGTTVRYRQNQ